MTTETILEPHLPIVDPHHHLWDRPSLPPARDGGHAFEDVVRLTPRYLLDELRADAGAGHNVVGTVYVQCGAFYRADGPRELAPVGEVEFVNGVGAMSASGVYGPVRACAGIIGKVDLTQGASAREVLEAMISRAPDRFRGIRHMAAWDASPEVATLVRPPPRDLLLDARFREGFACLAPLGLSYEAWVYHPQLPQVIELADAFPDTTIVLNHLGGRAGVGPYADQAEQVMAQWSGHIREIARRPNVVLKVGGIGMRLGGFDFLDRALPPTSQELADAWMPYARVGIEAFGPQRVIFESNFPVDKACCSYRVMWNTFKRMAQGFGADEKKAMFAGNAVRVYRLPAALAEAPVAG